MWFVIGGRHRDEIAVHSKVSRHAMQFSLGGPTVKIGLIFVLLPVEYKRPVNEERKFVLISRMSTLEHNPH